MRFGPEKQAEIFKKLAYKSAYQVGLEFGLDKVYSTPKVIRDVVNGIRYTVRNNPDKYRDYGITDEVIRIVDEAAKQRNVAPGANKRSLAEQRDIEDVDIKHLMKNVRNKAFVLIDKKLDILGKSRKKLEKVSFKELGTVAGISFDKMQILNGEATEHIAMKAKIDTKNMTPDEILEKISELRQANSEKNKDKK